MDKTRSAAILAAQSVSLRHTLHRTQAGFGILTVALCDDTSRAIRFQDHHLNVFNGNTSLLANRRLNLVTRHTLTLHGTLQKFTLIE